MREITVTLDAGTLRRVTRQAEADSTTVSALLSGFLNLFAEALPDGGSVERRRRGSEPARSVKEVVEAEHQTGAAWRAPDPLDSTRPDIP